MTLCGSRIYFVVVEVVVYMELQGDVLLVCVRRLQDCNKGILRSFSCIIYSTKYD